MSAKHKPSFGEQLKYIVIPILIAVVCVSGFRVTNDIISSTSGNAVVFGNNSNYVKPDQQKKRIRYRFRRIYNGGNVMTANHSVSTLPATSMSSNSPYLSPIYSVGSSAPVRVQHHYRNNGMAAGMSAHLESSQTLRSYGSGGGMSAAYASTGGSTVASAGTGSVSYASYSAPSMALPALTRGTAVATTDMATVVTGRNRRGAKEFGDGWWYDSDTDEGGTVDEEGNVYDENGIKIGTYNPYTGDFVSQGSVDDDNQIPIGSPLITLLLLTIVYIIVKQKKSSKDMQTAISNLKTTSAKHNRRTTTLALPLRHLCITFALLTLGVGQMLATDYILGPDGSWTQNAAHTLGSSGITNWVYKDLAVSHGNSWSGFKVLNNGTWYGKDSGGNNVTVGTLYTPTTSGGDTYCDFKANGLTYYFFFNTSTKKLMIQPKYYLAGTCGASNQNWGQTQNAPTYDATNGYFKWNTCSLTAGTDYKFKLCTYNTWSYYNFQYGGSITVSQGTKQATDGDNNIIFRSTYAGTAVITLNPTTNAMNIYCPYRIQYNKGANGTGTIANGYKTWKTSFTLSSSTFTRAGYTQDGWSTSDGGAKVYELGGSYTTDADLTLYPHWTENMSTVSLVSSPESKGTFTVGGAAATSTTAGVTTTRSVTAVPISGYHFVSWSITGGASISSTTTNPTTVTGGGAGTAATLTATFAADDVYSLTVAAGTGISAVTGSTSDIKAAQNISITATVATGYTWSTWTKTGAGTLSTFTAGTKNQTVTVGTAGDITLTASATENMSSLSTSCHYDAGNPSYSAPSKSVSSIGISTTADLTAAAPGTGYTFAGWTLSSNLVVTSGNSATDRSITVRTNGNGAAATAQANYEEDLSTPYTLNGGSAFGGTTPWWNQNIPLTKASGHSTESIAYYTASIASTNTGDSNGNFKFKIVNGATWYGLTAEGQYWVLRENDNGVARTLSSSGADIELRADVTGDYLIKVDYSSDPTVTVYFPLAVTWTAASIYSGNAATIAATVDDIESGKSIKFDVYAGSTATGDIIATWSGTTSSTSHTQNLSVTPSFGANETSKQYTVKVTYDGSQTATYTGYVYRKWDIYVQNNCSWASGIYYYGFGNGTNAGWPGTPCAVYNGIWYTVTLDGKYPTCVLNNNDNKEQTNDVTVDIEEYAPATFWDFKYTHEYEGTKYYDLESVTLSNPTVELTTYEVISTTQIYVKGTITNFGNDGTAASDMQEVGFKIGETKYTTTCTSGSTFERYITGLTANTSYSVKAYATNLHGTGESSATAHTTRATGSYTIKVRTGVSDPVPYIRAFVYSDTDCGGTGLTANAAGNGVAMTLDITGTTYKWYSYSLSNVYQKFYINENASSTETWDQTAPLEATCYWYHHGAAKNDRFGTMMCPFTEPQLMIETTAGGEDFDYHEMIGTTTLTKTMTLAAKSMYLFKIVHNSEWYGKASVNLSRAANSATSLSPSVEDNLAITTDVAGDYTFSFNTSTNTVTVTYPTAYTVTFGTTIGGGTVTATATSAGGAFTTGALVCSGDNATLTKGTTTTGYSFTGWYDNNTATGDKLVAGTPDTYTITSIGANKTVYTCYSPNNYTVTFDYTTNGDAIGELNGATNTAGTVTKSVTFASTYGDLPTATKTGYLFKGWFTTSDGNTQVTSSTNVSNASNHTLFAQFEPDYNVTIEYKCGGTSLQADDHITASPTVHGPTITAPDIIGYSFSGWTQASSYATFGSTSEASTTLHVTAATTITANYTEHKAVYFKNTLDWEDVYVTYDAAWNESNGTGNNGKIYHHMTRIGETDVWYDYIPDGHLGDYNIAFNDTELGTVGNDGGTDHFTSGNVIFRIDFDKKTSMFVPRAPANSSYTKAGATYQSCNYTIQSSQSNYHHGYWMTYNSTESGYALQCESDSWTSHNFTALSAGQSEFTAHLHLSAGVTKEFGIKKLTDGTNENSNWFKNTGTMTKDNHTNWEFLASATSTCKITTSAEGDYIFTLKCGDGRLYLSVEYPLAENDYRLVYTWNSHAKPSGIVRNNPGNNDIVSFYIKAHNNNIPANTLILQKCTSVSPETWTKVSDCSSILADEPLHTLKDTSGVYNFKVSQPSPSGTPTVTYEGGYKGNFYIRTDCADGGWEGYKDFEDNRLTYSEYSMNNGGYSHYFMKYVGSGRNIKFVIANDYSPCISDTLEGDTWTNSSQTLPQNANIRFTWNYNTNAVTRAYIGGAIESTFLRLMGNASNKLYTAATGESVNNAKTFTDDQNWIYHADVYAVPNTRIKLTAVWNSKTQYFKGSSPDDNFTDDAHAPYLIGGVGEDRFKMRVIYDFKTNRLTTAWMPSSDQNIDHERTVSADLLVIRDADSKTNPNLFSLSGSGKVTEIGHIVFALKLDPATIFDGSHSAYANGLRSQLFQVCLPYDVNVNDIYGLPGYGTKWVIQTYSGEARARLGWQSHIKDFWGTVRLSDGGKIPAGRGFVISHNLTYADFKDASGDYSPLYLYFPSEYNEDGYVISQPSDYGTTTFAAITCTKPGREVVDSDWRLMGLPGFFSAKVNSADPATAQHGERDGDTPETYNHISVTSTANWIYEWGGEAGNYIVKNPKSYALNPTSAYFMQYHGNVTWTAADYTYSSTPASVAAHRTPAEGYTNAAGETIYGNEYLITLNNTEGALEDQTYIVVQADATEGYTLNEDLGKSFSQTAPQVYTLSAGYELAANTLPDTVTSVVLSTNLPEDGEYVIRLDKKGQLHDAVLEDKLLGTMSNLTSNDEGYMFNGGAGRVEDRFVLHFAPKQSDVTTDLDDLGGLHVTVLNGSILIENGQTANGQTVNLYDAAGRLLLSEPYRNGMTIPAPSAAGVYLLMAGDEAQRIVCGR